MIFLFIDRVAYVIIKYLSTLSAITIVDISLLVIPLSLLFFVCSWIVLQVAPCVVWMVMCMITRAVPTVTMSRLTTVVFVMALLLVTIAPMLCVHSCQAKVAQQFYQRWLVIPFVVSPNDSTVGVAWYVSHRCSGRDIVWCAAVGEDNSKS